MLIVARMAPQSAGPVARLFGASDQGELPRILGVTQRHLFTFQGLYFHYAEFAGNARQAVDLARGRADFRQLSDELAEHVTPYDPATWRGPADAMARSIYEWSAEPPGGGR
ncbi:hypothetical protein Pen02_70090 [Plantactinospora endophytica]|uniref:TcmI family type II polyketide cyclase n=2 Tax=Plantactinospora endophytica TaxID=673535 RepID=A0ABQ4EBG4_9ACTN|nr:hypothetical protein Pen02_70090 [Plantactinospora endophytica]